MSFPEAALLVLTSNASVVCLAYRTFRLEGRLGILDLALLLAVVGPLAIVHFGRAGG